ncbi:hypothetical protein N7462_008105 [Penicillium macrosclerotiorum]|uniref:uncharacterized protein n=1 Tax=Penicillium macrosclerotiorum TaxID=303699 RepID=UPI002548B8D7|nr:uncharacterized protein N7462_008105 [Penicillium macrosclerotiorum]KAJ5679861.1 hypothetical protein N7462_008105 [Penicillium macrosclerotiorum]
MAAISVVSRGSDTLDAWTRRSNPKISIELAGQQKGLVNSYTTGDQIEGVANITVDQDTRFDEVEIVLQGTSHTTVERAACPGRTGSQQMFLKLRQPIEDSEYPTPRVLESGRTYSFPFTFVIPDRLLPQVCTHSRANAHVHRAHTMLPPTLGDPMLAGNGKALLDDMAPDMSQISYIVRVNLLKRSSTDHRNLKSLANLAKKIRIIPVMEEEPPINVTEHPFYCIRKEKTVPQTYPFAPPTCEASDTVSSVATVNLRFDPVGNEEPPRLGSMTSKLKASTFYSAGPWEDFPSQSGNVPLSQVGQGLFTDSIPLSSMCVASAQWRKHTASDSDRRDSLQSTSSEDSTDPSATFSGDIYYTASVVIPIPLPSHKTFVPTFHSCLMSRTYSLDLSLTYHTPGANVLTPTISLRLPIQIITQPKYADPIKSELGVVVTQAELDEFFQPRSVTPLVQEPVIAVNLAPPGYSETISAPGLPRARATS